MAPGEVDTTTFATTYVITQADVDAGKVENQATAEGEDPSGVQVIDESDDPSTTDDDGDPTVTPLPVDPKLELEKAAAFADENGDGFAQAGETITYTFTVTNTGNVTINNVTIDDPLVPVAGTIASLAPGAVDTATFAATYVITQEDVDAGKVENQAIAKGQTPDGEEASASSDDPSTATEVLDSTISVLPKQPAPNGPLNSEIPEALAFTGAEPATLIYGSLLILAIGSFLMLIGRREDYLEGPAFPGQQEWPLSSYDRNG